MNLHSDFPFWLVKEGLLADYPALREHARTDVVIIGAGVSGALIGYELARRGVRAIVVDRRHVGFGSTSASTGLLQYEIDNPLFQLSREIGEASAARSFELCAEAIDKLGAFCARLRGRAEFRRHPSLWYASHPSHVKRVIEPEFRARKRAGFAVRLLDAAAIRRTFGFEAPAAILSEAGATCNPYKLTGALLEAFVRRGGRVCALTTVAGWTEAKAHVDVTTVAGHRIRARHVVVAAGYESQRYLSRQVTQVHSTYAIASQPGATREPWHRGSMIWETKQPYLYMRTTSDGRIIVGGRDARFSNPRKRDALIGQRSRRLLADFRALFPDVPFEADFAWAGTFGETRDGLPYIGTAGSRRVHFAMGYGGNGITFSVVAADLLADAITGRKNRDAALFAFDR